MKNAAKAVLCLAVVSCALWAREGLAAGPKSNGSTVVTDDLPTGSAGSVGLSGGVVSVDGGLGQVAARETSPAASLTENGYFSREVSSPAAGAVVSYISSAAFSWADAAPSNPSGTLYHVELSTSPSFSGVLLSSDTSLFTSTITGLSGNTTYYARIRASYMEGDDSVFGPFGSGVTQAAAPTAGKMFLIGPFSFLTGWNPNGNRGGEDASPWLTSANSLPGALQGQAMAYSNNRLYVTGGYDGSSPQAGASVANLNSDGSVAAWSAGPPLPAPRESHAMTVAAGRLYVAGGFSGSAQTSVWFAPINADGSLGAWQTTVSLPAARYKHSLSAYGGYLYVLGGDNGIAAQSTVWSAPIHDDGTLGAWNTTTALPAVRSGHAVAVSSGQIYVSGGVDFAVEATVWWANIGGGVVGAWNTSSPNLPGALFRHAMAASENRLYVSGGDDGSSVQSTVYVATITPGVGAGSWMQSASLPGARYIHSMVLRGNQLYVAGGSDGSAPRSTVWTSSLTGTEYLVETANDPGFTVNYASSGWQTANKFEASGLVPNTTYYAQVRARNSAGVQTSVDFMGSTLTLAAAPLALPSAFTSVLVTTITAQWGANGNPAGTPFQLQSSSAPDFTGVLFSTGWGTALSATIGGLLANTSYYFRAEARNSALVVSPYTVLGATYTLANPPASSTSTNVTTTGFAVQWAANGDPSGTIYEAQVSTDPAFSLLQRSSVTASTSASFSGLQSATTFYARARAFNGNGVPTAFDVTIATMTGGDIIPPGISTGLAAVQSGAPDSALLTWIVAGNDGVQGDLVSGSQFLIQWSSMDPAGVAWSTAAAQVVLSTGPAVHGTPAGTVVSGLPDRSVVYLRLWTKDQANNYSVPSATVSVFASPFSFETVDGAAGDQGLDATLAVDRAGDLHVAYSDAAAGARPTYIKRTAGVWGPKRTIDAVGLPPVIPGLSLALDALGNPHVAYRDDGLQTLKYASSTSNGASWNVSTVDTAGNRGTYPSIAVDGAGNVHIAYRDETGQKLLYVKYAGGAWSSPNTIDASGGAGASNSIALDGAGNASISYGASGAKQRRLARTGDYGVTFSTQLVDAAGDPSQSLLSALALDGNGNPHLAYADSVGNAIKYASSTAGAWSITAVDGGAGGLSYASLTLDGTAHALIAYAYRRAGISDDLKFASFDGVSWSTQTVDSSGAPSLGATHVGAALDGAGNVHVAYGFAAAAGASDLRVAHWTGAGLNPPMGGNARGRAQAPYGFYGVAQTTTSILWKWTDNSSNELGFRLYGATSLAGPFVLTADTVAITASPGTGASKSYTETGLTNGTTYFRYVVAVDTGGVVASSAAFAFPMNTTDVTSPTINNMQPGDNVWRSVNSGLYNVTFTDTGGSHLSKFQVKAATVTGGNGPDLIAFTDVVTNINSDSYSVLWGLPASVFTALWESSTNYITIRAVDGAGNSTVLADAFYVKKDTTPPVITDNIAGGDNVIRAAGGTLYPVYVSDQRSGLDHFQYSASTAANTGDASLIGWTDVATVTNSTSYTTNWPVNFSALTSLATNYISVRVWDIAGSTTLLKDAFRVLKDTVGPSVALTAPASPFVSSLGVLAGTSADVGPAGVQGNEVNIFNFGLAKYWDGNSFTSLGPVWLTASGTGTWTFAPGIPWADGTQYQVVARSSDAVNNYSAVYATATFTFDSSTPTVGVVLPVPNSTISSLPLISGTSSDPGGAASGVSSVEVMLRRNTDGLWWNWFTQAWSSLQVSTVATGVNPWTVAPSALLQANLATQTSYFIAVRASDNAVPPNRGNFFLAGATFTFSDVTPPAAVTNLAGISGKNPGDLQLSWTAPGDNGISGIILTGEYRIQYATSSAFSFSSATAQVIFATATVVPGNGQGRTLTTADGLAGGTTYFLRLWTRDTAGNWSPLSNGATAQATPYPSNQIWGHVVKISSEGITAVEVDAYDGSGALASTTFTLADGSGTYALNGLAAGLYKVQATWTAGGITSSVWQDSIAMGSIGIDFVLNLNYTLSTLAGTLQSFSGASASGFGVRAAANNFSTSVVELYQNNRRVGLAQVGPTGRWTIAHLLPGKYGVRAYNGLEYTDMMSVDLAEGETKVVGFVFNPLPNDAVFAFPNPAKDTVTFRFVTSLSPLEAQISVFDIAGTLVREITGSEMTSPQANLYHAVWDLRNSRGEDVASGVYLFMVKVKGGTDGQNAKVIKKLAVVR